MMPPLVFNVFKPAGVTSYDVIRHFKKNLPPNFGKIGHFGTLDPFACGVLLIGIGGACKINNYVHDFLPKTYLAIGKLGIFTDSGDITGKIEQTDQSVYLKNVISSFSPEFIQHQLQEHFVGPYEQAPPAFSAAKYEGKALHQWAREGIKIKKQKKLKHIYQIEVVKYSFPYLSLRVKVSSGTYIRTLFEEVANHLGTIGTLIGLVREQIGAINFKDSLKKSAWPIKDDAQWNSEDVGKSLNQVIPLLACRLPPNLAMLYRNGVKLHLHQVEHYLGKEKLNVAQKNYIWVNSEDGQLLGMGKLEETGLKILFNFPTPIG